MSVAENFEHDERHGIYVKRCGSNTHIKNKPYLFTYQRFPELHILNTTNSLDGFFNHLKNSIGVYRGKTPEHRYKMIQEMLTKKKDEK